MAVPLLSRRRRRSSGAVLVVVMVCCCLWCPCGSSTDFVEPGCLKVPASEFVGSLKSTIGTVRQVASVVERFANAFGESSRLYHAVSDCLDLLDLSADELDWTLSASQNPNTNGNDNSTGNLGVDMRTWLSGALVNQDTCMDGFDGTTNNIVKSLIAGGLDQISSFIRQILYMVDIPNPNKAKPKNGGISSGSGPRTPTPPTPSPGHNSAAGAPGRKLRSNHDLINNNDDNYPYWVKPKDRRVLQQAPGGVSADVVVAADGSGNFTKVMDAILAAPDKSMRRYVIYVKRGVYREYVEITKKKWNLMMIGDGIDATVITGNHSFIDGWTTYASATFAVKGQGFIGRDMTIENTAGPQKHQAVAFRSDSDLSVLYRCAFTGYQDTLYAHSLRQFYRDCKITGTVDFIFGDGTVVFQNCQILARKGLPNQKNTITAQGRKEPTEPSGFSLQFCNISVEPDVLVQQQPNSTLPQVQTYLGRPWKLYSRTVIMQSYISNAIRPEGWLEWKGSFALDTLFYGEYMNYGPGAGIGSRVKWPGFHAINDSAQANNFTVAQFILGNLWLPSTGVKYTAGLGV